MTHCILFVILPENLIFILISKCVFGISILLLNNLTSRYFELQVYSGEGQLILLFSTGNFLTWCVLSHFSHVQLCDPMDCSLPCSSVHGILQARILEWVAISFSMHSPKYLHLHSDWWGRGEPWQGKRDFLSDYQTASKRNKLTILYSSLH